MGHGKKYRAAVAEYDRQSEYPSQDAVELVKKLRKLCF